MRKTLENCCLAVLSISMVVSLTGCKIIENKVADAKKDIEQLQDSTAITTTENSEKINTEKSETVIRKTIFQIQWQQLKKSQQ